MNDAATASKLKEIGVIFLQPIREKLLEKRGTTSRYSSKLRITKNMSSIVKVNK